MVSAKLRLNGAIEAWHKPLVLAASRLKLEWLFVECRALY